MNMRSPVPYDPDPKVSTPVSVPDNQRKQMDLKQETIGAASAASSASEPVGSALGKVGLVWGGLFAGLSLGDVVLIATLVYTLLQIYLLVSERIVKPWLAARRSKVVSNSSQEN